MLALHPLHFRLFFYFVFYVFFVMFGVLRIVRSCIGTIEEIDFLFSSVGQHAAGTQNYQ